MSFNTQYHYGIILAKCCANCDEVRRGSINHSALYCRVKARVTKKALGSKYNRVAPDGVCVAHEFNDWTTNQINMMGFNHG